jgi:hypothetical protein
VSAHPPARSWWSGKVRQFGRHVSGRVGRAEREALAGWLTPEQMALFEGMHRADQRHGLDVVAALRGQGHADPELLLAGLLHDCGKVLPGFGRAFASLDEHAERSAALCLEAGCGERVAELVRHQADPGEDAMGQALRLADEAS